MSLRIDCRGETFPAREVTRAFDAAGQAQKFLRAISITGQFELLTHQLALGQASLVRRFLDPIHKAFWKTDS